MDLAAKDKRCTRFDADFCVELLFLPLPGQTGTGPALGAARATRCLSRSNGSRTGSGLTWHNGGRRASALASVLASGPGGSAAVGDVAATPSTRDPVLCWEQEGYHRFLRQLKCSNCTPPHLEDWLLGRADNPAAACPGGTLCRGAQEAAAAAAAAAGAQRGPVLPGEAPPQDDGVLCSSNSGVAVLTAEVLPSPHPRKGANSGVESGINGPDYLVQADWSLVPWPGPHPSSHDGGILLAEQLAERSDRGDYSGEFHHRSPAPNVSTPPPLERHAPAIGDGLEALHFVSWAPL